MLTGPNPRSFHMYHNIQQDELFDALDSYHSEKKGVNWMTRKYFDTMKATSEDPRTNFRLHCVGLYGGPIGDASAGPLLAGEIGYSIGKIYTSLTGFVLEADTGHLQLACLGIWLERCGYSFWSMGHCYSPELDYKRTLGHQVYPRGDFLKKLKQHRGNFEQPRGGENHFVGLEDGSEFDFKWV